MIDDRRAAILQNVVEQYISTSQPVSSSTVAGGVSASSATIRSEMAALERDGYLQQPHTSAGRIPTDAGYRFFVDHLGDQSALDPTQQHDVHAFFASASGQIEKMLHETGRLLTNLTGAAAVVVGPDHENNSVLSAQIVSLSTQRALVVIVLSDGSVQKSPMSVPDGTSADSIASASARLARLLHGRSLGEPRVTEVSDDATVDALVNSALELSREAKRDETGVYVGGASQLAGAFEAVESVRSVITVLEQQYVVVTLIRDLLDRGITVSIGGEHNLQPLAQCSLIVAPTLVDGEPHGSVAILGPTRMDYGRAMAAVTVVSRQLGERLGDT